MVLVDTSVWIEYFKGSARSAVLKKLIHNNTLCINNLMLLSFDKHFSLMRDLFGLNLFTGE